jgi:hypothetical protein
MTVEFAKCWLYTRFVITLFALLVRINGFEKKPFKEHYVRTHHCRWGTAKCRPMLGVQGLWAGRDLSRATLAATRGLSFSGLIRRFAPCTRLLRHAKGCWSVLPGMLRIFSTPDPHGLPFRCLLRHARGCWEPICSILLIFFTRLCIKSITLWHW